MFAIQYLEPSSDTIVLISADVRARLRAAFERLPIDIVIVGWDLPQALVKTCAQETARRNVQLYLWHPLLTGSSTFEPRVEQQAIGLAGGPVPCHHDLPEFTFLCPNRPSVTNAVLEHLRQAIRRGSYQGVFLDRIRYPSPARRLERHLACFCVDCQRAADFDLVEAQRNIQTLLSTPDRLCTVFRLLFDQTLDPPEDLMALRQFLDFRTQSITRIVQAATQVIRDEGLAVGLDCFSPALTYLVGQDLAALNTHSDWIKIMTYGHALGPAGLPYELSRCAEWLIDRSHGSETETLACLADAAHLPLPPSLAALQERGLPSEALGQEVRRGRAADVKTLLAGIELVDLEGVTHLTGAQISADLHAFHAARPSGLALSWDLWRIPLERLDTVRAIWNATSVLQSP